MTPADLEARLRKIVPRLLVVAERHLTRILRRRIDRGQQTATAVDIPHVVTRAELDDDEAIEPRIRYEPPGDFLLVVDPGDLDVASLPDGEILRIYWRMLFGEAVFNALRGETIIPEQGTILREARHILEWDRRVPESASDQDVWVRFLAMATMRAAFMPDSVPIFFPALGNVEAIRHRLPASVDPDVILAATKPDGSAPAVAATDITTPAKVENPPSPLPASAPALSNFVRSAIENYQAKRFEQAATSLGNLVRSLAPLFEWDEATSQKWYEALWPLLPNAAKGHWPHAARLLFDLQTLVQDLSGELYAVDLPGYLLSRGKKPLRRPLTHARDLRIVRTLGSVSKHLDRAHLSGHDDHRLAHLVELAIEHEDASLRDVLGQPIKKALSSAGFVPTNTVERIARDAVVSELLDKICDRGFIRFGDLRDAIAKHNLKMDDLSGLVEWAEGDALLRADKILADTLDGIYHRGEIYLRYFHRISSLAFGNATGRWVTKFLILPFIGAFLTLEFTQHVVHGSIGLYRLLSKILTPKWMLAANPTTVPAETSDATAAPVGIEQTPVADPNGLFDESLNWIDPSEAARVFKEFTTSSASSEHAGPHLVTWPAILILGFFILGLLHWPAFRLAVWEGMKLVGRLLNSLFYTIPVAIWNSRPARAIRNHAISKFLYRRFSTAIALTLIVTLTLLFLGATRGFTVLWTFYSFVALSLFTNTPIGRRFEEGTAGAIAETWKLIHVNLIPGLIGWFVWVFRELVGVVERILYAVDEWFRFREGQTKPNIVAKALLGLIWFPIAYVVRFAFYLLLEPQVNPIKHFPVVTVSHKVLFTTIPTISKWLNVSEATVVGIIWCIPGVFGFLAWEFKENWRLYRATRSKNLRPLAIGHHGESIRGLLRPGFHSGTVPKLFRKARNGERRSEREGTRADRHKFEHELHHVSLSITRLIDRQMLSVLRLTDAWKDRVPVVHQVEITCQSIRADVRAEGATVPITFRLEGEEIRMDTAPVDALPWNEAQKNAWNMTLLGLKAYGAVAGTELEWLKWVNMVGAASPASK
ncbi:MAG: hypothetical protein U0798_16820 [Gemmataceae bacterium]